MMEFTLSRVAMMACGLILLAAVIAPFTNIFETNNEKLYQEQCDNISEMLDSFCESETEKMIVNSDDFLPPDSFVYFENHSVILSVEGKNYSSPMKHIISYDGKIGNGDCLKLTKEEGRAIMEKL